MFLLTGRVNCPNGKAYCAQWGWCTTRYDLMLGAELVRVLTEHAAIGADAHPRNPSLAFVVDQRKIRIAIQSGPDQQRRLETFTNPTKNLQMQEITGSAGKLQMHGEGDCTWLYVSRNGVSSSQSSVKEPRNNSLNGDKIFTR
ncbi:uncharacterized protein MELLADRAFT_102298 [Melampsora larici-populina 98AG31]|uniref:Uncharacterized protein n=1 Tax=Melampsora larici-populina (strain 98AG31 / pathotype 3-4-7) TaxID=747676 RepID=F4R7U3_MELLP|nr:uncharacterized protein MELLADRAFT_102298 [Melampsora larici-populina 98AG31]EGG11374.1 hypothetical protein MELLADRAFT_102298 [Melampsora larici-populina 98AG31]